MSTGLAGRNAEKLKFSHNSLDIIRIAAALQVAVYHLYTTIFSHENPGIFIRILTYFPGVPIFFFISGFVIAGAWQRDPDIRRYAISRGFRILPAYYAIFLFSLACILLLHREAVSDNISQMLAWIGAQVVLLPSWNPGFLRNYGVGVVNASLWTIPVEVTFYACAVVLALLGRGRSGATKVLLVVILGSLTLNTYAHYFIPPQGDDDALAKKILTVSPLSFAAWIWMFCVGSLACRWFDVIGAPLVRLFPVLVAAFIVVSTIGTFVEIPGILRPFGNHIGLVNMVALAGLMLGFAFRYPDLGKRLMGTNDYSYGLYLAHWPMMNLVLVLGFTGWTSFTMALCGAVALAVLSWFLVERPMLRLGKALRARSGTRRTAWPAERPRDDQPDRLPDPRF